jgi:hypothetical protein
LITHRTVKAAARDLFKALFGVEHDQDFVRQQSATREEVDAFVHGIGDGPDPDDLRFDMDGEYNNAWNMTVIKVLVNTFEVVRARSAPHKQIPARPESYLTNLLLEKFKRCKTYWKDGRPHITAGGTIETPQQLQQRLLVNYDASRKIQRHNTRRIKVCDRSAMRDNTDDDNYFRGMIGGYVC